MELILTKMEFPWRRHVLYPLFFLCPTKWTCASAKLTLTSMFRLQMHVMLVLSNGKYLLNKLLRKFWISWSVHLLLFSSQCKFLLSIADLMMKTRLSTAGWADSSSFVIHANGITSYRCFPSTGKKIKIEVLLWFLEKSMVLIWLSNC